MFDQQFESGSRGPGEDRTTWLILLTVVVLIVAGLLGHRIFFGPE